jgi:chemotaxis protein methyltransferase CheR
MREFEFTQADFDMLRVLSNNYTGILVPDDKFDMFYSRLSKRLRFRGMTSFKQYCQFLKSHPDEEFTDFINAITTNLTSFFRENHHFEFLIQNTIPALLKINQGEKQIKVWSAGCSTGEEPYSLAMVLKEHVPDGWDIKILATDLDTNVLATARGGVYTTDRLSGIDQHRMKRWFQKGTGNQANKVRVKEELRQLIQFKQLNLMGEWPMKGMFDFIFCRNVLIYFDNQTKLKLVGRYVNFLKDHSLLFIGHSESLYQFDVGLTQIGTTIYQKTKI